MGRLLGRPGGRKAPSRPPKYTARVAHTALHPRSSRARRTARESRNQPTPLRPARPRQPREVGAPRLLRLAQRAAVERALERAPGVGRAGELDARLLALLAREQV